MLKFSLYLLGFRFRVYLCYFFNSFFIVSNLVIYYISQLYKLYYYYQYRGGCEAGITIPNPTLIPNYLNWENSKLEPDQLDFPPSNLGQVWVSPCDCDFNCHPYTYVSLQVEFCFCCCCICKLEIIHCIVRSYYCKQSSIQNPFWTKMKNDTRNQFRYSVS